MDIFSQKKFLVRLIIILVALNIAFIGFFWWNNKQLGRPPRPTHNSQQELSALLKKELNLTDKQTQDFNKIRTDFFEKEKTLSEVIRNKRDSMNLMMFSKNADDEQLKLLASGVAENEHRMELLRIDQAARLRSICTPGQLLKFEALIREIRDYLKPDEHERKP